MNEGRVTNVFIYEYMPREWHCREIATGITAMGVSRAEVLAGFRAIWNDRAPFLLVERPPPRPKRPDEVAPTAAVIEGDTVAVTFHRLLVREFHSDHHPGK